MGIRSRPMTCALTACLTLGLLGGCSADPGQEGAPSTGAVGTPAPEDDPAGSADAGAAATSTEEPPRSREWPELPTVEAADLPGWDTSTISDQDAQVHLVVPRLAGDPGFSGELVAEAEARAQAFRDDYQVGTDADPDMIARPFLTGQWRLVAASEEIVGIETETFLNAGASTQTSWTLEWYQPGTGTRLEPWDLVRAERRGEVVDLVTAELAQEIDGFEADRARTLLDEGKVRLGFSADGELFVGFDAYEVAPGSDGGPAVVLAQPVDDGWLTQAGQAARRATTDPRPEAVPLRDVQPEGTAAPGPTSGEEPTQEPTEEPTQQPGPSPAPAPSQPQGDVDCAVESCVALTFDDGPSGSLTPRLLDILSADGAVATFYVTGGQVSANPSIVARQVREGHQVGNHTWSHPSLPNLGPAGVRDELARTNQAIAAATGSAPTTLRPPYGATDETVRAAAAAEGLAQVTWDVDTRDWEHRDPARTLEAVKKTTRRGSIILMHDVHETTIQAVPDVVAWLRSQGYRLVTVDQLVGRLQPGQTVSRRG